MTVVREDLTVDDLADLPSEMRYELIEGRLLDVSRNGIDQYLIMDLLRAFRDGCDPSLLAVHSLSLAVDNRNELRPAAAVIDVRRGNANRSPVSIADTLLVVDLVTPNWHFRDMQAKATIYATAGVPRWWVVDPLYNGVINLTEYRCWDGSLELVQSTDSVFATTEPFPITLNLRELASWRNETLSLAD